MRDLALNTKKVTLSDVAARVGVDKATASRALSGKGSSAPKTKELVLRAAQELGFQPDLYAQRLANGRSNKEIALFAGTDLGVGTQLIWALTHGFDERGYEVEVHDIPQYVSHVVERQVGLVNKVRRQRPSAIVAAWMSTPEAHEEIRKFMAEDGVVVCHGWAILLPCDQVIFDSAKRVFQAAQHLLEMGHRKIGMCFHGAIGTGEQGDLHGFKRALEQYSVPLRPEWLFAGGKYELGGAKLAAEFLQWKEKPTALCIINDRSASAFVNVLAQNGVSVPNDVSVVSFDDTLTAHYAYVPLTSVSYPLQEIAQHIVEMTISRLEGYQGAPRRIEVHSHLVERRSCAPPR